VAYFSWIKLAEFVIDNKRKKNFHPVLYIVRIFHKAHSVSCANKFSVIIFFFVTVAPVDDPFGYVHFFLNIYVFFRISIFLLGFCLGVVFLRTKKMNGAT